MVCNCGLCLTVAQFSQNKMAWLSQKSSHPSLAEQERWHVSLNLTKWPMFHRIKWSVFQSFRIYNSVSLKNKINGQCLL